MSADNATRQARALEAILGQRLLGIIRAPSGAGAAATATTLIQAGLRAVEISVSTPGAIDAVSQLVAARQDPAVAVGAGTIRDAVTAERALAAGADLLVTPVMETDVIRAGRAAGAAVIAGAATPTEAVAAVKAGASLVKLFPASAFTPAILADILQALPDLRLVPTGGIEVAEVGGWLRAGAAAVALGSSLTAGSPAQVSSRVRRLLAVRARPA